MGEARARGKLLAAAWRGEFDNVKASIESGEVKDVDLRDDDGVTALRFAAQYGHFEIAQYLLVPTTQRFLTIFFWFGVMRPASIQNTCRRFSLCRM